jgi:pimeloyl-ACP methyl ester carboxylesterase
MTALVMETALDAAPGSRSSGTVASRDGTSIGYTRVGRGPGVVILHGAMSTGTHSLQLAELLGDAYTVYLPDRRGRGLSGRCDPRDGIDREVEDLEAILSVSAAERVLGISSGALVLLYAALRLPEIRRAAIFEPPIFSEPNVPARLLGQLEREVAAGEVPAALVTGMKGGQMGLPIFNLVPRRLLELLVSRFVDGTGGAAGNHPSMRAVAPTLVRDFSIVAEMAGRSAMFAGIDADVLLMGGSSSPRFLSSGLDELQRLLPSARRVELSGVGHDAPWDEDLRGHPRQVADALRTFFA